MSTKSGYWLRGQASKHSNLHSQQRRLRHLTCIIGRNIDPNLVPVSRSSKSSLLMLYFTIHAANDLSIVFYKSEIIENTLNPNWKEFDSQTFLGHPFFNTASAITVFIWGARKPGQFHVILQNDVEFSGLVYLQEQLRKHEQQYENNSLLFQMFGGYYGAPSTLSKDKYEARKLTETTKVPNYQVRSSYKLTSLMRLHGVIKAIQQTRQQVNTVQKQMDSLLDAHQANTQTCAKRESLVFTNKLLREENDRLRQNYENDKKNQDKEIDKLRQRERSLQGNTDELEQYISDMKVNHSTHVKKREALTDNTSRLNHRRRQLAAELSYIYPIIELPTTKDSKHEYAICGIRLPNSEDFVGEDDTMLSVSLGYVAQLVYMMAKFLELPLRYPIRPMGSRSSVFDVVTDKLLEREREFPLYLKGKEKFQFHYGVFLLNKNIAQLRYHNEIGTSDLRNTLENLKKLLEDKFGVRIIMKSGSGSVMSTAAMRLRNNKNTKLQHRHSVPVSSSSPIENIDASPRQHANTIDFLAPVDENNDTAAFRPRSSVLSSSSSFSGLPAVAMKGNKQHPYIARKGSKRKNMMRDTKSLSQSLSPDLITTSCEEIVRMANEQPLHSANNAPVSEVDSNTTIIDCAEECLDEGAGEEQDGYQASGDDEQQQQANNEILRPLERTFSDALIIPDPFEREPDDLLSPDANLNVNNLIV